MDAEIKEQWVAALRSGKYKQGQQAMRHANDTFCCLGVLCDIVAPGEWMLDEDDIYAHQEWFRGLPSPSLLEKAGLGDSSAHLCRLVGMNDSGYTFEAIANYIEEYC